jgi:hypothetical protein
MRTDRHRPRHDGNDIPGRRRDRATADDAMMQVSVHAFASSGGTTSSSRPAIIDDGNNIVFGAPGDHGLVEFGGNDYLAASHRMT